MASSKNKSSLNIILFGLIFLLGFFIAGSLLSNKTIEIPAKDEILKGNSNIVAVTAEEKGLVGKVEVTITKGEGKVLINTNPFIEPDTQYSANIAVDVAKKVTNVNLDDKNVIFDFDIGLQENQTGVVGGPSAGASMTLATIAAIEGKQAKNIGITGGIMPDGSISQVGAIPQKAQAAADKGLKLMLIPAGQGIFNYYEKEVSKKEVGPGFTIYNTKYVPKQINLKEYFKKESNLDVIEVNNINDIMSYAF